MNCYAQVGQTIQRDSVRLPLHRKVKTESIRCMEEVYEPLPSSKRNQRALVIEDMRYCTSC